MAFGRLQKYKRGTKKMVMSFKDRAIRPPPDFKVKPKPAPRLGANGHGIRRLT
jgi:hypothetical protein